MTEPDPVALAVEAALTPGLAEAAAEVAAWTRAMAARAHNGWDMTFAALGSSWAPLRLRSLRVLAAHAYATGEPCDGQHCEEGGAAHCHRCAEVEADELLAERGRLDAALEEERRLIDGERRAHEALTGAVAWMLEGTGADLHARVEHAIKMLHAPLDPQQHTTWPEDWAAHRAERDAAREAMRAPTDDEITGRLAQIRAREQAATPGEWTYCDDDHGRKGHSYAIWAGSDWDGHYLSEAIYGPTPEADGEFTAHARADIPWLLDLVEELRGQQQ